MARFRFTPHESPFVRYYRTRPGQPLRLNTDVHRFVVTVDRHQEGRFSNIGAAMDTARDLSALNTKPWTVRDSVTGQSWTNQRAA